VADWFAVAVVGFAKNPLGDIVMTIIAGMLFATCA